MHNFFRNFSLVKWLGAIVGSLVVLYIGLIAFVMSYAAVQTEMAQSVRDSSAQVSLLEVQYFNATRALTEVNPVALGYSAPIAKNFVSGHARAALLTPGD